jgi:hypothetical protein
MIWREVGTFEGLLLEPVALFLSHYHRVQSVHQIKLIVRELSSEERLATAVAIVEPNLFLCLEKRDVPAS